MVTDSANSGDEGSRLQGASARRPFSEIKGEVEALLFAAEAALDLGDIRTIIGAEVSLTDIKMAIRDLNRDYEGRAFSVTETGGRYQMRTREEYVPLLRRQFQSKPRSLTKSALETLAIVAYKQPVTRAEVNALRGVDSASILHSLEERGLIVVAGKRKELGNPLEFRTTAQFLEVFGLASLQDLPRLRSLQMNRTQEQQMVEALQSLGKTEDEEGPTEQDLAFSQD